ncbi:MAG: AbrB/MazE/SpoVT family DNA-binding domain-containing protein [Gammaproteobacteria bacterium]|nr:AbrB/MazE/SpoVT family DNA-binding domain-containing protein [Gammaproteobacteria bacterium]
MSTAKVFTSGNSQAVRLPKELRFDVDEVEIFRRGDEVVLRKPQRNMAGLFDSLAALGSDPSFFAEGRGQGEEQQRESFD